MFFGGKNFIIDFISSLVGQVFIWSKKRGVLFKVLGSRKIIIKRVKFFIKLFPGGGKIEKKGFRFKLFLKNFY